VKKLRSLTYMYQEKGVITELEENRVNFHKKEKNRSSKDDIGRASSR